MPSTAFDSFYLKDRFGSAAMRAIWSDRAMIQAWLDVEAGLAAVEARLGVIPARAGREIVRAARVGNLDLRAMRREFDRTWNPVVPLVAALCRRLTPSSARYVHWGATSKNIFDTGTALQIKASYAVVLRDLERVQAALASLARRHRDTIMAGRTHGQHAMPVTFGYKAAVWLDEMMRQRERLLASRGRVLVGELGGAVGTHAALGAAGPRVQKALMQRLGLGTPVIPTKTAGDRFAEFFVLLLMLSASLGKVAQNVYNLQQSDIEEVCESAAGKVGSSAMPHKQNPVASGSVVLLGRLARSRAAAVLDYIHAEWEDDHRQGETAWSFAPEVCLLVGAQLTMSARLLRTLVVKPRHMRRNLERGGGVVASEALMMALADAVGRKAAHGHVLALARAAARTGAAFHDVAQRDPLVRRHVPPGKFAAIFDYRRSLGLAGRFVDDVLAAYEGSRRSAASSAALRATPHR
jgi:adenylosuccinate lyase